jgi:glycosyltransferase involved in cell wall biosynthesis
MRIVATHMDFSLHWPARLQKLKDVVEANGGELQVIEVATRGSPYEFSRTGAAADCGRQDWITLFGDAELPRLSPWDIDRKLWAALERISPDVVMAGPIAFPVGTTAVRWCRARRRGIIVTDDARLEDVPRSRFINAVKRCVYRNVDAMLVPAASHLPTCKYFGIAEAQVFYGVDVVDNEWFGRRAALHRESGCRELRGTRLPEKFFLGVGRQVPKKNWPTLVDAYAAYRKKVDCPWDLVLVGDGPQRQNIDRRIAEVGSAGIALWPFLTQEEMCGAYAAASCLALPSFHGETWGLVVNEAMACGLPVLVSDQCGCASTLVRQGENGWQFSPRRPEELTEAMVRMSAQSPQSHAKMAEASRSIIREWSPERFAREAWSAIQAVRDVRRGFTSLASRAVLAAWRGRFRPT